MWYTSIYLTSDIMSKAVLVSKYSALVFTGPSVQLYDMLK